jgi:hypothetical protein
MSLIDIFFQKMTKPCHNDIITLVDGGADKGVVHPAVDLAAGVGVYTAAYVKHYRPPTFQGTLEWYLTDWTGDPAEPGSSDGSLQYLQDSLKYMEEQEDEKTFLCEDCDGWALYANNKVELIGLSNETFHGLKGVILCPDPNNQEGQFAVQVNRSKDPVSLKAASLLLNKASNRSELLEHFCKVDIGQCEIWSNLSPLHGKCAFVTWCTTLLACLGYQDPFMWKDALKLTWWILFAI